MRQKTKEQLTNHLLNYYENSYLDQNELNNFMHSFLDFVFSENDLDTKDYNINIRFSDDVYEDALAFAYHYEENGEPVYSVVFRKTPNFIKRLYSARNARKKQFSKHKKESPKYETLNMSDIRFDATLQAMITAGHEYQHLIQFIKSPKLMEEDTDYQNNLWNMAEDDFTPAISIRESRIFRKSIISYLGCYSALSDIELDADKNTVYYCQRMIETVAENVKDEGFLEFLRKIHGFFAKLGKERTYSLLKTNKTMAENQKLIERCVNKIKGKNAIAVLKKHNLGISTVEEMKEMENCELSTEDIAD